jgi:hypothetical protein
MTTIHEEETECSCYCNCDELTDLTLSGVSPDMLPASTISLIKETLESYLTDDKMNKISNKTKQILTNTISKLITNDYVQLDKSNNILDTKENIPQGEEATLIHLKSKEITNNSNGLSYIITRYGIPELFDHEIIRYNNYKKLFDDKSKCVFNKFDCNGSNHKIVAVDYDSHIRVCSKHKNIGFILMDINIANIKEILPFFDQYTQLRLAQHTNNYVKINLLKKMKIIIDLASKGIIKNRKLDPSFVLYGIHFYDHKFDHKNKNGWALVYTNFCDSITHVFLNELTDDENVKNALVLFAYENIIAKQYNDIPSIDSFMKYFKKPQYKQLMEADKNSYIFDVPYILYRKLNI